MSRQRIMKELPAGSTMLFTDSRYLLDARITLSCLSDPMSFATAPAVASSDSIAIAERSTECHPVIVSKSLLRISLIIAENTILNNLTKITLNCQ